MSGLWLGLDSSREAPSLALLKGETVLRECDLPSRASHQLPGASLDLLRGVGMEPEQLEGLAVSLGPGSFTGIRAGLAATLGLSRGWRKPLKGVDCYLAWAGRRPERGSCLVLIPLGRDLWTAQALTQEAGGLRTIWGPEKGEREKLLSAAPKGLSLRGPLETGETGETLAASVARLAPRRGGEAKPWYGTKPAVMDKVGA